MVLNEEKGTSYAKGYESLGFAGGLLMDLFLQGKISFKETEVEIIDGSSTGDEFLDPILEIIKTSDKKRSLMNWIDKLSQKYDYYYLYFDLMEQQGILKSEISPGLKTKLYYLQKPEIKSQLLEKIHDIVDNNDEVSINLVCLLTLLEESSLIKEYQPRNLRKKIKTRIKETLSSEKFDSTSRVMILRVKKEIVNVIGARNMFLTDGS
ncbi:MAG: GOLPH3/VPS74 family protein [Promethearchaeota archaeon]